MYTVKDLEKFDYFSNIDLNHALDSLTGVLSRGYILGFTKHLIENKVPFAMGIIDIDNFKLVNDNYGHDFGDKCLTDMAENLAAYFKTHNGLVGRYGGDEFVFLYFGDTSYDNVHKIIADMYNEHTVVRKRFKYHNIEHWLTSTIGCASYPKDAKSYTELFADADKTLYRGKSKGRNCFIVYVEEKHKDIDVHKKETSSVHVIFNSLNRIFENVVHLTKDEVVRNALDYLTNILNFSQAIYIKNDGECITNTSINSRNLKVEDFDFIYNKFEDDEIYVPKNITILRQEDKNLKKLYEDFHMLTFIASKVQDVGHLVLLEGKVERVWQENDFAILMYLDRLIQILYN